MGIQKMSISKTHLGYQLLLPLIEEFFVFGSVAIKLAGVSSLYSRLSE